MFICIPPGYSKNDKVLDLNKSLYGLQQSLLFWQQKLIIELKTLGF